MKYYSETLKKLFDSEEACASAEKEHELALKKQKEEKERMQASRKARAEEVEAAMKEAADARKKYNDLLAAFCKDYGSYHYSFDPKNHAEDLDTLFKFLF